MLSGIARAVVIAMNSYTLPEGMVQAGGRDMRAGRDAGTAVPSVAAGRFERRDRAVV